MIIIIGILRTLFKFVYIIGDIHGNFHWFKNRLYSLPPNSNIIQIGDFGLGFSESDKSTLESVDKTLIELNQYLYVIRGNHDRTSGYFDGTELNLSHLYLLPDYSVREIEGKKCLFVGGAISLDRSARTFDVSYWEDEGVNLQEDKIVKCDILFTHTGGTFNYPQNFSGFVHYWHEEERKNSAWAQRDLLEELTEEKQKVQRIIESSQPIHHYYGHFHHSFPAVVRGIKTRLLDIEEVYELRD